MQFYSKPALQLIFDQVNRDNPDLPIPLSEDCVAIKGLVTAAPNGSGRNSRVTFVGKPGKGYRGQLDLLFDRVNLGLLYPAATCPTVYYPTGITTQRAGLALISETLGVNVSATDLATPDGSMVPTATPKLVALTIHVNSPAYLGQININIATERIGYFPKSGPGTKYLTYGDENFGYFGKVSADDLFTNLELWGLLLQGKGTTASRQFFVEGWYKFFYKGKVIFMPQAPIAANISWTALYNLGYMYGAEGVGKYPSTTPVNQARVISSSKTGQKFYFAPRTPLAGLVDPQNYFNGVPGGGDYGGTEIALLAKLYSTNGAWAQDTGVQWSQWIISQNTVLNGTSPVNFRMTTPQAMQWGVGAKDTPGTGTYWWPVLELVDIGNTVIPIEGMSGSVERTIVPLPATAKQDDHLAPAIFGLPKTVDFIPIISTLSPQDDFIKPAILGIPKTVLYQPVVAKSAIVTITKTDLTNLNGELGGF